MELKGIYFHYEAGGGAFADLHNGQHVKPPFHEDNSLENGARQIARVTS